MKRTFHILDKKISFQGDWGNVTLNHNILRSLEAGKVDLTIETRYISDLISFSVRFLEIFQNVVIIMIHEKIYEDMHLPVVYFLYGTHLRNNERVWFTNKFFNVDVIRKRFSNDQTFLIFNLVRQ